MSDAPGRQWDGKFAAWPKEKWDLVRRLRRDGAGWTEIARQIGCNESSIRKVWARRYAGAESIRATPHIAVLFRPTPEMIAARDARYEEPQTLTQVLMGDPPFSQSALARR